MIKTIEAIIDEQGKVYLLEPIKLPTARKGILLILEDQPVGESETTLLSESVLSEDWNRPEEEAAWAVLQQVK